MGQGYSWWMGFWQIFLPTENCTTPAMFLRQTATGAGAPCQMYCQACRQSCQTSCQMTRKLPAGMHVRSTEQQARCATSSDVFLEGWILRFSCVFLGCTRYYGWYIAVSFQFLACKALHCTLYHAEHLPSPASVVLHLLQQWLLKQFVQSFTDWPVLDQ